MAFTRTAPSRAAALVWAAVQAVTGTAAGTAAAATPSSAHAAASTLITVTVTGVPALSVNAFQGSYATSTVAQNGGDASADGAQDPTGVLDRITLDQPAQSKAHSDPAKNWADAQPAVEYSLHGKKLYAISSVQSHAECPSATPSGSTYVHTAPDSVSVLGTNVGIGKTTVPVTGAQLGVSDVDHGTLDVTYSTTATTTQSQQTSAMSAHAHLDLSISGTFFDKSGKQLYSGLVQKLRLGDVQASCQNSGTPTSAPSTTVPTPGGASASPGNPQSSQASGTSGSGEGPGMDLLAPPPVKGGPDPAAYAATPRHGGHAGHPHAGAKGEPGAGAQEDGPAIPAADVGKQVASSGDSDGSLWWALLSVVALGGGAGLYFVTRRRGRGQHQ